MPGPLADQDAARRRAFGIVFASITVTVVSFSFDTKMVSARTGVPRRRRRAVLGLEIGDDDGRPDLQDLLLGRGVAVGRKDVRRASAQDAAATLPGETAELSLADLPAANSPTASRGAPAESEDAGDRNHEADGDRGDGQSGEVGVRAAPDLEQEIEVFGLKLAGDESDIHP